MKSRLTRLLTPQFFAWLAAISITIGLLCFRLGSLTYGKLASIEQPLPTFRASLHALWNQPLGLPITLSRLLIAGISPNGGHTVSRLPSALLGLLIVFSTYWLLRRWYGYRLALFGSVLLATAPWFLHVSRLATSDVIYPLAMTAVFVLSVFWHQSVRRLRLLYISALITALLLYVPGAIWLLLCLLAIERKHIVTSFKAGKQHALWATIVFLLAILPLGHALLQNGQLYRPLLGLPSKLPSILDFLRQCGAVWEHIFVRGYTDPVYNVGGLAITDTLTSLAFATGIYLYAQHATASRTRLLASLWLVGTILVGLHGPVNIALIMPIVAILATGGIGYLLHLWLRVFPRNPLARSLGIGLVGLLIVFAVTYNLRNYYEAWPHSPATAAAFHVQQ